MVELLPADREATAALLNAVGYVDLIIPRGSSNLINFVRENARILSLKQEQVSAILILMSSGIPGKERILSIMPRHAVSVSAMARLYHHS